MKKLAIYRTKRNFNKTREPIGDKKTPQTKAPIFVIQKHAARRLHYDFRLEHRGVLKSWAVPKGPSVTVGEKRLAMRTEDHPMDYASFEGYIPKGEYGGGEVIVWDYGVYQNLTRENNQIVSMDQALEAGKLVFQLEGVKLKGLFSLHRMHNDEKAWLLIKMKDQHVYQAQPVETEPKSVLSNLTIEALQKNRAKISK